MSAVFLDTSGWLAAVSPKETGHAGALSAYREAIDDGAPLVTTAMVLGEMHAMLLRARGPRDAARFVDAVMASSAVTVVSPSVELIAAAVNRWLHGFRDQRFSLCDAVSFEVMRRERIADALALDRHFRVAGFHSIG